MQRTMKAAALAATLLACASAAQAQRTTEQFIPLGQSPGISGVRSYIGPIVTVDVRNNTFTVQGPAGLQTIKVVARTRIWLDRSAQRLTNVVGSMTDVQAGRRVEVTFVDETKKDTADWIKVAIP
jgi:hypothetical protein